MCSGWPGAAFEAMGWPFSSSTTESESALAKSMELRPENIFVSLASALPLKTCCPSATTVIWTGFSMVTFSESIAGTGAAVSTAGGTEIGPPLAAALVPALAPYAGFEASGEVL